MANPINVAMAIPMPFNPIFWGVVYFAFWWALIARCGSNPLEVSELFCQHIGLYPVADFIQLVEIAFSLSRSRQESELEEFIRRFTEFHRRS